MYSLLVPLAAVFTGDSQHAGGGGSSTAPSPWARWEAFQAHPHILPAIGRASVEQIWFLKTLGKPAPRCSSRSWPQAHTWTGCGIGEALLQDPFQKVRGGGGCRCQVGSTSSSACSGMRFMETATGTTEDKPWQWHWIGYSISSWPQGSREANAFLHRKSKPPCLVLSSSIQNLPRCSSVKDRKAAFIVCHCLVYEYIKKVFSALLSQFCSQCFPCTSYKWAKKVTVKKLLKISLTGNIIVFIIENFSVICHLMTVYYAELRHVMRRLWDLAQTSDMFCFVLCASWCRCELAYSDFKWFDIYNYPE